MNTQQVEEPTPDWNAAIARIPPAQAIYEAAGRELDVAESAYNAAKTPEPSGIILYIRGQSFTPKQSHENLRAAWEAWQKHDQELQERFNIEPLEAAFEAAVDSFVQTVRDAMALPAPDLAALRWKLDYLLEGSNGSTDSWALSSIEQVKRDMNRLMRSGSDTALKAAWARRLTALKIFNALPDHERDSSTGHRTPAAQACWDAIDAADEEIREAVATTVEGARIQLNCAMLGMIGKEAEEAALLAGDMEAFAECADLDFPVQLAFSALRSLSAMELAA